MKYFPLIFIAFILINHNAAAQQYAQVQDVNLIASYKKVLQEKQPHVFDTLKLDGVYHVGKRYARIVYHEQGVYKEAIVNSRLKDMMLVAKFEQMSKDKFPDIVTAAFKNSKYSDWNVEHRFKASTPYSENFYALDVTNNNKRKRLYYSNTGGYQKPPY